MKHSPLIGWVLFYLELIKLIRKTHNEFVKEVYELVGDEYVFLEEYKGNKHFLTLKHNIDSCNHVYEVQPKNFLKGQRCPKCTRNRTRNRNRTNEDFIKEVINVRGDIYDFLSEFKNTREKIKIKHKECGHEWGANPTLLIQKTQKGKVYCPKCNGGIKTFNTNTYKVFIREFLGEEYEVLGEYINSQTPIEMKHLYCNHRYRARPNDIIFDNNKCPKCAGNIKRTTEEFKELVSKLEGNNYVVIGEYINSQTKITIKHNIEICNHEYETTPNKFIHDNQRCPKCYQESLFVTKDNFNDRIFEIYGDEFVVLGEYENYKTKVKFQHNSPNCNNIFHRRPDHILTRGITCDCQFSKSNGEKIISKFLDENNIRYIAQYKFDDCKYKNKLPFDFGIFNDSDDLLCIIEYDGEGHFEEFRFSKDKRKNTKKLKETQRNDKIKNEYCRSNNIPLYRIPYWKFDELEGILYKIIHNEYLEIDEISFLIA